MHRFYLNDNNILSGETTVRIAGEDYRHVVSVLRLRTGDRITVSDGAGRDYECEISDIADDHVDARIVDVCGNASELPVQVTLYQGVPKSDKMELIVQKAVELGAVRIVPVMTSRTVVKLDASKMEKKRGRYQTIAEAAGKQSGRGIIPEVGAYMSFAEAVEDAKRLDAFLFPYENAKGMDFAREVIGKLKAGDVKTVGIMIGPEGGFSDAEVAAAEEAGATVISLGNRILRTETAGLCALSVIGFAIDK